MNKNNDERTNLSGIDDKSNSNKIDDCTLCRMTGTIGLSAISIYLYMSSRKQEKLSKNFIVSLSAGKLIFNN
jgi:hypothetical protein